MRVIGTAGHIDHGKSTLVHALTGIDPDRLPEEKARGMTIELGFAWLDLGFRDAEGLMDPVGVIDVPGHERFIRHMLAGVGGIDLALLVIAADEIVMPQTREHLAILDLLGVRHGVVALTKCDLVDSEWIDLATEEVRSILRGTTLADSPIIPCSTVSGAGLEALRTVLAQGLRVVPERSDRGRPHLPIDRVFTRSGYGTVVTGTLLDGTFRVGQEVELMPSGRRARIRGLQSHHRQLEQSGPGRRVAVNLAGTAHDEVKRGMVVCSPGSMSVTHVLDVQVRVVRADTDTGQSWAATVELKHSMPIVLHTGAVEAAGQLRLLDADRLGPGEEGWVQIRLERPIAVLRGDRVVLRNPSPAATLAGGTVVVVNPPRRRRFDSLTLERLATLARATPEELLSDALISGPATAVELAKQVQLPIERIQLGLATLADAGLVRPLLDDQPHIPIELTDTAEDHVLNSQTSKSQALQETAYRSSSYWTSDSWLEQIRQRAVARLATYHQRYPLRRGVSGEELREEFELTRKVWQLLLERWNLEGLVISAHDRVHLATHRVHFTPDQQEQIDQLLELLRAQPFNPPNVGASVLDQDLLVAARERGDVEQLAEGILITQDAFQAMCEWVLSTIDSEGLLTVADTRDHFQTSRKLALALLEHLDDLRLTRRLGEGRVRGSARHLSGGLATAEGGDRTVAPHSHSP